MVTRDGWRRSRWAIAPLSQVVRPNWPYPFRGEGGAGDPPARGSTASMAVALGRHWNASGSGTSAATAPASGRPAVTMRVLAVPPDGGGAGGEGAGAPALPSSPRRI